MPEVKFNDLDWKIVSNTEREASFVYVKQNFVAKLLLADNGNDVNLMLYTTHKDVLLHIWTMYDYYNDFETRFNKTLTDYLVKTVIVSQKEQILRFNGIFK